MCLSRDTTESDLKQRKELRDGGVVFVDAAPVCLRDRCVHVVVGHGGDCCS